MYDTTAISQRQQRILDVIAETIRERGYPPTVREIGEAVGLTSSSSVHAQLANLERKGLLHKDPTKPRAMALSEPRAGAVTVPWSAGSPPVRRSWPIRTSRTTSRCPKATPMTATTSP